MITAVLAGLSLAALPGPVTPATVGEAIAGRRGRVAEFQAIKEAAEELGMRIWLFGGTAAGFAHYVRWDLAREAGDARYRESFFDYDFTNIYRSTQDADLVVDATPEQAEQLETLIKQKMSFLQGSKEHWEVRLLRQDRVVGGQRKQALLANPDFLGQNTDSNSTGMIELTDPPRGERVVRDLRDWDSPTPFFLQDVTDGRLHYYLSPTHAETSRFRAGDNPELFSVIRYLVKAFQYDLQVDGEDLRKLQAIIDAFDPSRDYQGLSDWAKGWLERYGPNLIRHSVNIEYAWNTLERLGLRKKLIALSDPTEEDTLAWWLSREPLRGSEVGQGGGQTARELGIDTVAHETRDFLAYESITRDTTLRPNVLISRPGYPGESAAQGPGFYTRRGRAGAAGTGLTIRFRVDPRAREGSDYSMQGDYVIVHNRAALRVIPESLDLSLLEFFQGLASGRFDGSDRGVIMKLRRRLLTRPLSGDQERSILAIVSSAITEAVRSGGASPANLEPIVEEWFELPASRSYPHLLDELRAVVARGARERQDLDLFGSLAMLWLRMPDAHQHPEVVELLARHGAFDQPIVMGYLRAPGGSDHPELVPILLQHGMVVAHLAGTMALPEWGRRPEVMRMLLEKVARDARRNPDFLRHLLPHLVHALTQPQWRRDHPELVDYFLEEMPLSWAAALLEEGRWSDPRLVLRMIDRLEEEVGSSGPDEKARQAVKHLLRASVWRDHPGLRQLCGGEDPRLKCLRRAVGERGVESAARLAGELGALGPASPGGCGG